MGQTQLAEATAASIVRDAIGDKVDAGSLTRLLEPRAAVVSVAEATPQEQADAERLVCVDEPLAQALAVPASGEQPTSASQPWAPGVALRVALPGGTVDATVQLSSAGLDELVTSAYAIAGEAGVNAARAALSTVVSAARAAADRESLPGGIPDSYLQGGAERALARTHFEWAARYFEEVYKRLRAGPIRFAVRDYQEHAAALVIERLKAARAEVEREAARYGFDLWFLSSDDARSALGARRRSLPDADDAFDGLRKLHARLREMHAACEQAVERATELALDEYLRALEVEFRRPEHGTAEPDERAAAAGARSVIDAYLRGRDPARVEERRIAAFAGYMELRAAAARAHPVLHRIAERSVSDDDDLRQTVAAALWTVHRATRRLEAELLQVGGRRHVWKYAAVFEEACANAGLREGEVGYAAAHERLLKGDRSAVGELLDLTAGEDAAVRALSLGLAGLVLAALTGGTGYWLVLNAAFSADSMISTIVTHEASRARFTSALDTAKALSAEAPSQAELVTSLVFDVIDLVTP